MKTTMKTTKRLILGICAFCLASLAPSSLTAGDTAPASDWDVASYSDPGVKIESDGVASVTVSIGARTAQSLPVQCDLLVGGSDPANVFTGDFAGQKYSGIRFRSSGDGSVPAAIELIIYQRFGSGLTSYTRIWRHSGVGVSTSPGEWTINDIPLTLAGGWSTDYTSERFTSEELWARDMENVQAMIVRLVPEGLNAQAYSISDFRLFGEGIISEAAKLTSLQLLFAQFGISGVEELTADMLKWDSDGDGMSDYYEVLAGMDPHDASSVFQARVAVGTGANTVSWDGVLGLRYGVMRSNDLTAGFELIATDIVCARTGLMGYIDDNPVDNKPNFYKIVKY